MLRSVSPLGGLPLSKWSTDHGPTRREVHHDGLGVPVQAEVEDRTVRKVGRASEHRWGRGWRCRRALALDGGGVTE